MAELEQLECLLVSKSSRTINGWRRFTFGALAAYLAVTGVMLVLCIALNTANFLSVRAEQQRMLDMICDNQGTLPSAPPGGGQQPGGDPNGGQQYYDADYKVVDDDDQNK